MAAMTLRRGAALAAMLAVAVGCGDELDPAWKVKSFRIFGATVDNVTRNNGSPDVAPGETRRQLEYIVAFAAGQGFAERLPYGGNH